jgi:hypothetical protein
MTLDNGTGQHLNFQFQFQPKKKEKHSHERWKERKDREFTMYHWAGKVFILSVSTRLTGSVGVKQDAIIKDSNCRRKKDA